MSKYIFKHFFKKNIAVFLYILAEELSSLSNHLLNSLIEMQVNACVLYNVIFCFHVNHKNILRVMTDQNTNLIKYN